eukprot:jgi/Chrpa1/22220/Chrysochromulina_OHIO_Genome00024286-RA
MCSTKLTNLPSAEIFAQLTVNFTVTMDGLEQQLLSRVVQMERPELEEQKKKLVEEELIEVLSKSKITAVQVNEKLTTAVDTDIRINAAREEYRPAARRGALLYFMVVDMASINNMYMKAPIAAKRIINFMDYMTNYVTRYMHRGLFERPKKIWTLVLAMTIQQIAGTLSATYAGNLLKAGGALDAKSEKPVPAKWMPESAWYDHDAPETRLFPDYNERLDQFEKMLLVRAIRVDRALLAVDTYIASSLGRDYLLVDPLDIAK